VVTWLCSAGGSGYFVLSLQHIVVAAVATVVVVGKADRL
jgi:hypothetical protein